MVTPQDRLIEIAQRLDELAGDDASELQTLSAELGEIAEKWPILYDGPTPVKQYEVPRWVYEMQQIMEKAMQDKMLETYGGGSYNSSASYHRSLLREITVAEASNMNQQFRIR